jgi:AcrR family transcriptional regulator
MPSVPKSDAVEADKIRERLLDAAIECFDRYGIEKTVMEDIAKAAGLSRPAVYRYLGDRNTVLLTLVHRRADEVIKRVTKVISSRERIEDKLVDGILLVAELTRDDKYLGALVSPRHLELADDLVLATTISVDLTARLWLPVLEQARARGQLRPELDLNHACEWLSLVQFIFVARTGRIPGSSSAIRGFVQSFVIPTFVPDARRTDP